jgi:hypothetical protein
MRSERTAAVYEDAKYAFEYMAAVLYFALGIQNLALISKS